MSRPSATTHSGIVVWSLVAAPALMLAGDFVALVGGDGSIGVVATVLLWLSFYAYVGVAVGIVRIAGDGPTAMIGALLTVAGCLMGATIMGLERTAWAMLQQGIDRQVVLETMMEPALFHTSRSPGLLFPLGLVVLTVALVRARALSAAAASLLTVGIVLFPVGRIVAGPVANVAGDLAMLVVLAPLGLRARG